MTISKKLSIIIFDHNKISNVNHVIFNYTDSFSKSSSHILFDVEPISLSDIAEDLTFFRISADDEESLDKKIDNLFEDLNQLNTDYSIRNVGTGEFYTAIDSIGKLIIKLDKFETVPEGTYKQIDKYKNIKTEFGYCKGYKPSYCPIEGNSIENLKIMDENIYLFSKSSQNMSN